MKNLTKIGVLLVMLAMTSQSLFAMLSQPEVTSEPAAVTVKGSVVDNADGTALPGASVVLRGTQRGISTDAEGKFVLQHLAAGDTLVFSYMGYHNVEYVIPAQAEGEIVVNIRMHINLEIFGEVAVSEVYRSKQ